MSRLVLVALLALCVATPALGGQNTRESLEDSEKPPQEFPKDKALKYDASKLPTPKTPLEVPDLTGDNDTEPVKHPNVSDPGTTHEEGTESNGGSIHACALPDMHERNTSASNWLADTGNVTKVCHLPLKSLHGATGNVRVCSIPHDAWNSSYTVVDGTISKELLAELNTSSVKCVTPSEALSNGSSIAAGDSISNGSLPSAWLRSNDTIYIYIIPQEWLRKAQSPGLPEKASEVEDLTKGSLDVVSSTPDPAASTSPAPAAAAGSSTLPPSTAATSSASSIVPSNSTVTTSATDQTVTSTNNSNEASSPSNSTVTTVSTPIAKSTESTVSATTSTPVPAVAPGVPEGTTEKPKEVPSKPTENPKKATTAKPSEQSKEDITKTTEKPKEEMTKTTEKVAVVVTKKPAESSTKKPNQETTEKPKDVVTTEEHSIKNNEIEHKVPSPQPPEALSQQHSEHNHVNSGKTAFLPPTESAAILAGVFVAIALLGYAGLLLWRRVLEKRYGNREMLVNEDDDFDTSDMRHFEL